MIDFIRCDYPLPFPEEAEELKDPPIWSEFEFQTYSLRGNTETYTIEEDGQVYKESAETELIETDGGDVEIVKKNDGIEKVLYTGELIFSGMHMEEDKDYFFEFIALFWKGELKEINLKEWNAEDNAQRKIIQEQFSQNIKRISERKYKPWFPLYKAYYYVVSFILGLTRYFLGLALRFSLKLERWITLK
tara:strand:+ start:853 stop:1422 length:570 start_codon:yes stop_codon:yes gene_type:complete